MPKLSRSDALFLTLKIFLSLAVIAAALIVGFFLLIFMSFGGIWTITMILSLFILPLLLPLIWLNKKKRYLVGYGSYVLCFAILLGTQLGIRAYNNSITIDTAPAINVHEYMPFDEGSKIVKIDSQTLSFDGVPERLLPKIDGAAAAFPVYSAFVHAVYPDTVGFNTKDGAFVYNNTVYGYRALGEKATDIFIGAAPSEEQVENARQLGTTFEYTQIGSEAFVFFVHRDNPIESLSVEQIKGIYSGEITNWSEVGGKNEKIVAFQRNEGSGSQSMLIRFMAGTPIMPPDTQTSVGGMGDIIEEVADYKNKSTSIGFSFRFYVEGIIKNPDIKMIAIDGIAPTVENIKNGSYPIIAPVYAVTYKDNPNPNVQKLIDWMLSEEGQYIIEQSGYVGVGN
ncbi:MAG: substrate-binding domain-containing protein [Clostridia bacterium]|nr:substrate-binding domain-containing protein [Clostridia bacterium]